MLFGGLSIEDAITYYFEKHDAVKRGDFELVKNLKQQYPQLFNEQVIQEIENFIRYLTMLQLNPDFQKRYKEFLRDKAREKFTVVE